MAFDYTGLRDGTVEPLIAEFGKSGSILVTTPPGEFLLDRDGNQILDRDGNPITVRDVVAAAPYGSQLGFDVAHAVTLVQTRFKKSDNNGTLVEMGDVLFLVSTEGVTIDPSMANRMTVGGVTYQVIRIDPLQPGDVVMLWKVHARK